jgi:hypothetical protein
MPKTNPIKPNNPGKEKKRMTTEKQIAANRLNAQKSTGPKTPEGKAAVSRNALASGLLAHRPILKNEDPDEFNSFYKTTVQDLNPIGSIETLVAQRIVNLAWRLKRAGRMETGMIDVLCEKNLDTHGIIRAIKYFSDRPKPMPESWAPQAQTLRAEILGHVGVSDFTGHNVIAKTFHYEGQIERSLYKAIFELQKLQFIRQKMAACSDSTPPQPVMQNPPAATTPNISLNPVHPACGEPAESI